MKNKNLEIDPVLLIIAALLIGAIMYTVLRSKG